MLKHIVTCLTALFIITGCKKNKQEEAVLHVITSADQAPFEFFDSATHTIQGFDIDLAREIAKRLNMDVEIRDIDFGGILPSLQSGQADMAISGITRTAQRETTIDFSMDYYRPRMGIVSLIDAKIETANEFQGKRIGAQLGTYHQMLLEGPLASTATFEVVARNRLLDLVQELLSKNIQGVVMDYIPATKFVASHPTKLIAVEFTHPDAQAYAIAFPKGSALKEKVNAVIKQLIDEGFIQALEHKWLQPKQDSSL